MLISCGRNASFEGQIDYQTSISGEKTQLLDSLLKAQNAGFTLYYKKDKVRIDHRGGQSEETMIMDYTRDSIFFISHADSSYVGFPLPPDSESMLPELKQEQVAESRTIAGYNCEARKVSYKAQESERTIKFWEAKDLRVPEQNAEKVPILPRGVSVKGIPLRLEASSSGDPFKIIHQAVSVQPKSLDEALFVIPLNYKKSEYR
ncbi:MAG: DUF4412 domain-containing protein [Bacteroidia bacterium]|nr:DUF4412 domain-containing protein [Bacteroidia bacterium]